MTAPLNPRSSLDTDVVRHIETGKAAGSSKPNRQSSRGGAETSPSSGQGQSRMTPGEPGFPGPSAEAF